MKRILTLIAAFVFAAASFAQAPQRDAQKCSKPEGKGWCDRMQAEKIAFYTKYIGLTAEEAQAFWPVFNQAEAEQKEIAKAARDAGRALNLALAGKTEGADIAALTKDYVKAVGKTVDNEKYLKLYSKILPAEKVAKVFLAEEKFRRQQIQKLNCNGAPQGRGPQGGHGSYPGGDRQGGNNGGGQGHGGHGPQF